jgi:hypothetical protein
MKRFVGTVLVVGIVCLGFVAARAGTPALAADDDAPALLQADRAFEQAFDKSDKLAASKLLDSAFTWTDATGAIATRTQVLQSFSSHQAPKVAIAAESAQHKEYAYGSVGVVQVNAAKMHVLRVWVKRPAGWRALLYQEVQSLDAPPTFTPGTGKVCDNPCKTVPYHPKTEVERAVIASYTGLETAAVAHSASGWSAHVADEFAAASSNSDQLLDKPSRMAGLEHEKMGGVSPTALLSARMFEFGDAVVMVSRHKPDHGKLLHITRVWIKRDGNWVETLSYQTAIQAAPVRPPR